MKSPAAIQTECSLVVEVCVDQHGMDTMAGKPSESVPQEGGRHTKPFELGNDGETLDEASGAGAPGDHVSDRLIVCSHGEADAMVRSRQTRFSDVDGIHGPSRLEGPRVDVGGDLHGSHRSEWAKFVEGRPHLAKTGECGAVVEFEKSEGLDRAKT